MIDQEFAIPTADGRIPTFVTHPERGGPHPVVLFFMDAPGIREELRDMARRLGTTGYYVMLPNLYYRAGVGELGAIPPDENDPLRQRMFELMYSIDIERVMGDAAALLDFAATQSAASQGPAGAMGYCMSGRYAVSAAARFPERINAAASLYGTHLVTDQPDSPHVNARKAQGELYFACAEIDRWAPQETIDALRRQLGADGIDAEIEIYPGTHHGFAFPSRPLYDKAAAERHWERLHALFARRLKA